MPSEELKSLFEEDQEDRSTSENPNDINWSVVSPRDLERRKRVLEMENENLIQTAEDYYHAAFIMQHGATINDIKTAHRFAKKSYIDLGNNNAAFIFAATKDRSRMFQNKPQKYGTQIRSTSNQPFSLWKVDGSVTDEQRKEMGLKTIAEMEEYTNQLNSFNK